MYLQWISFGIFLTLPTIIESDGHVTRKTDWCDVGVTNRQIWCTTGRLAETIKGRTEEVIAYLPNFSSFIEHYRNASGRMEDSLKKILTKQDNIEAMFGELTDLVWRLFMFEKEKTLFLLQKNQPSYLYSGK